MSSQLIKQSTSRSNLVPDLIYRVPTAYSDVMLAKQKNQTCV